MYLTIDSSVFVSALDEKEIHHKESKALFEKVKDGVHIVFEPYTVLVEVVSAIRRKTGDKELARKVKENLLKIDTIKFFEFEKIRANKSADIGVKTGNRGMDAIVVQIAKEFNVPLVTLDGELTEKSKSEVEIEDIKNLI